MVKNYCKLLVGILILVLLSDVVFAEQCEPAPQVSITCATKYELEDPDCYSQVCMPNANHAEVVEVRYKGTSCDTSDKFVPRGDVKAYCAEIAGRCDISFEDDGGFPGPICVADSTGGGPGPCTCPDGTSCSSCVPNDPPRYCDANGIIVDKSSECDCPVGYNPVGESCEWVGGDSCEPAPQVSITCATKYELWYPDLSNPDCYSQVCMPNANHAEVVEVRYKGTSCDTSDKFVPRGDVKAYCAEITGRCDISFEDDGGFPGPICVADSTGGGPGPCTCLDGTSCSSCVPNDPPRYCDANGIIVCKCSPDCGCPPGGGACLADGSCENDGVCPVAPVTVGCEPVELGPLEIADGEYILHMRGTGSDISDPLWVDWIYYKESTLECTCNFDASKISSGTYEYKNLDCNNPQISQAWAGSSFKVTYGTDSDGKPQACFGMVDKPASSPCGFGIIKCTCDCIIGGETKTLTAYGTTDDTCAESCGGMCGGYTDCSENCDTCCDTYCSSQGFTGRVLTACKTACTNICDLNTTIYGIVDIVYYIAGIIAAIMLVFFGYKIISSDNPKDRDDAKRGIIYVIMALVLIAIASALVNMLLGNSVFPY